MSYEFHHRMACSSSACSCTSNNLPFSRPESEPAFEWFCSERTCGFLKRKVIRIELIIADYVTNHHRTAATLICRKGTRKSSSFQSNSPWMAFCHERLHSQLDCAHFQDAQRHSSVLVHCSRAWHRQRCGKCSNLYAIMNSFLKAIR